MNEAYTAIVQEKVIPYFENMNTSLTVKVTQYLSNMDNREEILKDFARVTVYIRSLKVERTEQVVAYTFLDLISDIGKQMTFFRSPAHSFRDRILGKTVTKHFSIAFISFSVATRKCGTNSLFLSDRLVPNLILLGRLRCD